MPINPAYEKTILLHYKTWPIIHVYRQSELVSQHIMPMSSHCLQSASVYSTSVGCTSMFFAGQYLFRNNHGSTERVPSVIPNHNHKICSHLEKLQKESYLFSLKISPRFEKLNCNQCSFHKNTDYMFKIHFVKHSHFYQQHIVKIII